MIGAAADDARTEPLETVARSGGVGFAFDVPRAVGSQEFSEVFTGAAANACAAMWQIVGPRQHFEVFFGIYWRAGFEERDAQSAFGENFRGHAAAGAGTDNHNVVAFGSALHLSHAGGISP